MQIRSYVLVSFGRERACSVESKREEKVLGGRLIQKHYCTASAGGSLLYLTVRRVNRPALSLRLVNLAD